jgi:AraC-like DNA-binding protein
MLMKTRFVIGVLFLFVASTVRAQVTFVIESLPRTTPGTDTIFVCGTFNNWVPNDARYAVKQLLNGQLSVTVPIPRGTFEYKFTRGSWTKVETNPGNRYIDNRVLTTIAPQTLYITIDNWLDLGGAKQPSYLIFYFFACAFHGVALCLLIWRIRKADREKRSAFLVINGVLTGLLLLLVLYELADPVWKNYLAFAFQVSLFCWAPLVWFFVSRISGVPLNLRAPLYWTPPAIAVLFVIARLFNAHALDFFARMPMTPFSWITVMLLGGGLAFNIFLYMKMERRFPFLKLRTLVQDPKCGVVYYFFWGSAIALLLIPVHVAFIVAGFRTDFVEDFYAVAVMLSSLIFVETYFLWRYPEILREEKNQPAPVENLSGWIERLDKFMQQTKPYKKTDLSVSELAEMLGTKPHVLSKVINDTYNRNFRDFVNAYRIDEFIALANTREFRHYTFLALAQEVGFNSKSTFNLAFKKFTGKSPSEYFKTSASPIEPEHTVR